MFPVRSGLYQQIREVIKNKWCKECTEILERLEAPESSLNSTETNGKDHYPQSVNSVSIGRMRERIEALEDLNDRLYYYLNFIVENLPELIIKTIQSDFTTHAIDFLPFTGNGNGAAKSTNGEELSATPTPREKDVLILLEKGYCAKEIANELFISESTVITHKKNLKKKFNAKNTVELVSKIHPILLNGSKEH